MSGLKDRLKEMNYEMTSIIHPNSLKKIHGGAEIVGITGIETNTMQAISEGPICKERAISKESP